jgi:hypothetical protein
MTLRISRRGTYNSTPLGAHWCSRLTRCPLKAETTGSSPVCATNFLLVFHVYPVRLTDVMLQLNEPDKTVDVTICFRPKRR